MIDLGLSKLALIGVVALVVIGPEKLPKVARMAGTLFGRAQRYINEVKSEVSREIEIDELRKMHTDMQQAASDVQQSFSQTVSEVQTDLNSAWSNPGSDGAATYPLREPPSSEQLAEKAKNFRKKKLARSSAIPSWYKRQNGQKSRVISGAARVARYRPAGVTRKSFH
ncbi:MAG: sec-independent protein translocase protein TatB [Burkholderiales bacterium]|jgi:sec-independent protein translocase protein TatB